jgi:hypothetical protein
MFKTGSATFAGSEFSRQAYYGQKSVCLDVNGNVTGDNPLTVDHTWRQPTVLNGTTQYYGYDVVFENYATTVSPEPLSPAAAFTSRNSSDVATELVARTNPSQAHISIPTFIGEAKDWFDLPKQIREFGRSGFLKAAASANLSWRFFAKPLISDVQKLLTFNEAVEKRLKVLARLRKDGFLSRRLLLGVDEVKGSHTETLQTFLCTVKALHSEKWTRRSWATCKWLFAPSVDVLTMDSTEERLFARRLTGGCTTFGMVEAMWELLPWSWLIDWFGSVGTWLCALNNSIQCYPSRLNLMNEYTYEGKYSITSAPTDLQVVPGNQMWVSKTRLPLATYLAYVPFIPSIPAFSAGQLSILGSLAIQRLPGIL